LTFRGLLLYFLGRVAKTIQDQIRLLGYLVAGIVVKPSFH
jgi:hypothetical protein